MFTACRFPGHVLAVGTLLLTLSMSCSPANSQLADPSTSQERDKRVSARPSKHPLPNKEEKKTEQRPDTQQPTVNAQAPRPPGTVNTPESTPTVRELEIGEMFEKQGRLGDAEKAYAKALETASGTERDTARKRLQDVLVKKGHFQDKYLKPSWETANSSFWVLFFGFVGALLVLLAAWIFPKMVRRLGERRGRNKLQIEEFVDATGEGGAVALTEQLKNAVEQVQEYYKPRDRFRLGSFSSLTLVDSPGSEELIELVTEVVSSASGKLMSFFTKSLFRPQYRITGMVQKTGFHYSCWVKLADNGSVLSAWERKFLDTDCPELQEQLAFEVVIRLRERVDTNGD